MSKKPKQPRTIYRVKWQKAPNGWRIDRHDPDGTVTTVSDKLYQVKRYAIQSASWMARDRFNADGSPTQRITHNKNGRISKGGNAEASYGCDSKAKG